MQTPTRGLENIYRINYALVIYRQLLLHALNIHMYSPDSHSIPSCRAGQSQEYPSNTDRHFPPPHTDDGGSPAHTADSRWEHPLAEFVWNTYPSRSSNSSSILTPRIQPVTPWLVKCPAELAVRGAPPTQRGSPRSKKPCVPGVLFIRLQVVANGSREVGRRMQSSSNTWNSYRKMKVIFKALSWLM